MILVFAGSLSLSGNMSPLPCSPMGRPRDLLDQCLLNQAYHRYEQALADDEVTRLVKPYETSNSITIS